MEAQRADSRLEVQSFEPGLEPKKALTTKDTKDTKKS